MATILIIIQILSIVVQIPKYIKTIKELIDLIRRLPKVEQKGAASELLMHVKALKAEHKSGKKVKPVGAVYSNLAGFEMALRARLSDLS